MPSRRSPVVRPRARTSRSCALRVIASIGALVAGLAVVASGAGAAGAPVFFYGSDSAGPAGHQLAAGSPYPYSEPGTGGVYGGYVGEVGTWTNWLGCTTGLALNPTAVADANRDEGYRPGGVAIPGVFFYWFAAGPGADPRYDGKVGEAYAWGVAQAKEATASYYALGAYGIGTDTTYIPLLFMDVETQPLAGYANGWNERVDRCGRITNGRLIIPYAVDRATFDGFWDYLHYDTIFHPGVYSTVQFWNYTFGTGVYGHIPNTFEWTPVVSTGRVLPRPLGFCQAGTCAEWFGGIATDRRSGWQWNQNGGDYDQWDARNLP